MSQNVEIIASQIRRVHIHKVENGQTGYHNVAAYRNYISSYVPSTNVWPHSALSDADPPDLGLTGQKGDLRIYYRSSDLKKVGCVKHSFWPINIIILTLSLIQGAHSKPSFRGLCRTWPERCIYLWCQELREQVFTCCTYSLQPNWGTPRLPLLRYLSARNM